MTLTQTRLNSCLERCRILSRIKTQLPRDILLHINLFFTKIRTIQKLNEILAPVEIEVEPSEEGYGLRFSWLKSSTTPPHLTDSLDITFVDADYFILKGYYETIALEIDSKIKYEKDFAGRALVHLKHFTETKKKKNTPS